jgi:hypothetical protein
MSGVGIYSRTWRSVAPKLAEAGNSGKGWDIYAAEQVVPHCRFTSLIQHIWRNPSVSLELVSPDAVIFHQDKQGRLIELLDQTRFGGACAAHPMFSYTQERKAKSTMRKWFKAENTNRAIRSHGMQFVFDNYGQMAGTWRGVFTTADDTEIAALSALANDCRQPVWEIAEEEYNSLLQKKTMTPPSVLSAPSVPVVESRHGDAPVVAEKPKSPAPPETPKPAPVVESIESLLKIEPAVPSAIPDPVPQVLKRKPGRPRKTG